MGLALQAPGPWPLTGSLEELAPLDRQLGPWPYAPHHPKAVGGTGGFFVASQFVVSQTRPPRARDRQAMATDREC
jgi:hypothetical protein